MKKKWIEPKMEQLVVLSGTPSVPSETTFADTQPSV